MAQIIECPACSTRYKINKAIPEGGRNVKCARCAHQWKLVPEDAMPDEDTLPEEETADNAVPDQAEHHWQDHGEASGVYHEDSTPFQAEDDASAYEGNAGASVDEEQWTPLQADEYAQMNRHASAAYDDPMAEAHEPSIAEDGIAPSRGRRTEQQRASPPAGPDAGSGRAYPTPSGAYDVPSGIFEAETALHEDVASPDQLETEDASAAVRNENWSSRFMGPRWKGRKAAPPIEEEEDEDPESVIRETFRSVLERSDEEDHAAASLTEHTESPNPYGSIYDAEWNRSGDENDEIPFAASAQNQAGISDPDYFAANDAIEETASDYMHNEYDVGEPDMEESYNPDLMRYDSEDLAGHETLDRFAPQADRPHPYNIDQGGIEGYEDEPNEFVTSQESEDYAALYGDRFDGATDHLGGEESFDETLTGLRNDGMQDHMDDAHIAEHQNRSGLALAAGWVAFLSLMGGFLLGLVNFRQDVMATLPGTINMYRMLGYEVELNKVDFASVDYKWSEIDGRPAIELRGEVVNITDKTVKVPPVLVNVQSTSGAALKAEASVPTDQLGPRDSATFTLELVSPPEDVSRIELEFAPKG